MSLAVENTAMLPIVNTEDKRPNMHVVNSAGLETLTTDVTDDWLERSPVGRDSAMKVGEEWGEEQPQWGSHIAAVALDGLYKGVKATKEPSTKDRTSKKCIVFVVYLRGCIEYTPTRAACARDLS